MDLAALTNTVLDFIRLHRFFDQRQHLRHCFTVDNCA